MDNNVIMELRSITKVFPGVKALDEINMSFERGTVHAVLGENGAGKSTLMKILFGSYKADSGQILWDGKEIKIDSPHEAQRLGIAMVHQDNALLPTLDVCSNIFLGKYPLRGCFIKKKEMIARSQEILDSLHITAIRPQDMLMHLSPANRKVAEIAKAAAFDPKVLILDEPTASLTETEIESLFEVVRHLKAKGTAIIYISHRMEEIFQIADVVSVLRDGKHIVTKPIGEVDIDSLIGYIVGHALNREQQIKENLARKSTASQDTVLRVKNLTKKNKFSDISFDLHKGEVLGIGGLVGAGRTEILEAIFGFSPADSGEIVINNRPVKIRNTTQAVANGLAFVPEERLVKGLFPRMDVMSNINIAMIKAKTRAPFLNQTELNKNAEESVKKLSIKTPSIQKPIGELSGGNQQKCILARWLLTMPDILFLDEPTHGIDVGAKAEIYNIMRELSNKGISIIIVSSEMEELMLTSDRIITLYEGRLTGELKKDQFSKETIMQYIGGFQRADSLPLK
ncbi:MAG: sugar ABC transporter ATP-binding protein [Oscillospiraceae bacterium]|nr:sugar ABC transporter ATP-binding protein [Oscillospiraceae bacterium]